MLYSVFFFQIDDTFFPVQPFTSLVILSVVTQLIGVHIFNPQFLFIM